MGIESAHTELHTHAPSNVTLSTGEDTQVHTLWVSGNGSSVTLLMNPSVILQFTCGSGWETPLSSTLVGIPPPPPIRKDSFLPYLLLPLYSCFIMSQVSSIVSHCPPLFFVFFFASSSHRMHSNIVNCSSPAFCGGQIAATLCQYLSAVPFPWCLSICHWGRWKRFFKPAVEHRSRRGLPLYTKTSIEFKLVKGMI